MALPDDRALAVISRLHLVGPPRALPTPVSTSRPRVTSILSRVAVRTPPGLRPGASSAMSIRRPVARPATFVAA